MRDSDAYRRRGPTREPRARVLIVCEGSKTEPLYFEDLKRDRQLTGAEVRVCGPERGTAPECVVAYAQELRDKDGDYDEVWCVIDRDQHDHIADARERARDLGMRVAFSNPCFEIWYLLHFRYSTKHRERDEAASDLRKHIAGYAKGASPYSQLLQRQPAATANAAKLRKHHASVNEGRAENPSTNVDELVVELNALADKQKPK